MRERAEVISLKGKYARVKMSPSDACDNCTICKHDKPFELSVYNEINANIRDIVTISIDTIPKMFAVIMYISPIISMIVGYFLGLAIFKIEDASVALSFIFLLLHASIVAIVLKKKKYRAFIVEINKDTND